MILKKDYDILCYQGRHDILWIGPFSYSPFRHVARVASATRVYSKKIPDIALVEAVCG